MTHNSTPATPADLVKRFLALTEGMSHADAAREWGVTDAYVRQLRDGKAVRGMQEKTRRPLLAAIWRLEGAHVAGGPGAADTGARRLAEHVLFVSGRIMQLAEMIQAAAREQVQHTEELSKRAEGFVAAPPPPDAPQPSREALAQAVAGGLAATRGLRSAKRPAKRAAGDR